jgi:hypothetical protein
MTPNMTSRSQSPLPTAGFFGVVADAPASVRLEEWQSDAQTYGVTLTGRDIYNLSNAMVDALRGSRIRARAK